MAEKTQTRRGPLGWVKRHKKLTIFLVIVLVAALVLVNVLGKTDKAAAGSYQFVRTTVLTKTTLSDTVSVTGTVKAGSSASVTASDSVKTYKVTAVNVAVGDTVRKGDVIATLDTTDVEKQIANAQLQLSDTRTDARKNYTQAVEDQTTNLATAQENLDKAQKNYDTLGMDDYYTSMASAANSGKTNREIVTDWYTRYAEEIAGYLPQDQAAVVTGSTKKKDREAIIQAFKARKLRYLVNVAVLTTGFDAPHVDLIAILRPTESVSLYQQIVGRGLRLAPGKTDCLILDYAGNPHDLYSPEVGTPKGKSDNVPVQVFCPACGFANTFWGKTTADGTLIEHFGRRCQGWFEDDEGHREQCDFRFRFKNCPQCNAENDIAARRCRECDTILVDPDDMLKAALKLKDALVLRCSGMTLHTGADEKGEWLKITYYDEDGADVSERFRVHTPAQRTAFEQLFIRPHTRTPGVPLRWITVADIVHQQVLLRHPDFVVARKKGQFWQVREKLFDYEGRFRRANELRG